MIVAVDRQTLGDELARAMEPEAWAEYDAGKGVCSNQAGWKCLTSIAHAGAVMDLLATKGPIAVPAKQAASAIEARQGGNGVAGAVEDESAVREAETPEADEGSKP